MESSSNANKKRQRKHKKSSSAKSTPSLPSEAEIAGQAGQGLVSEPPPHLSRGQTAAAGQFQATPVYHGQLAHSNQQPVPYTNALNAEYASTPRQPVAPSTPRPYAMYGGTGMPRPFEAAAPPMVPSGGFQQDAHWYDANGVLYINTDRGLVPASSSGAGATSASAMRFGYPGTGFLSPGSRHPRSPSTAASSSAVSSSGLSSDPTSSGGMTSTSSANIAVTSGASAVGSSAGAPTLADAAPVGAPAASPRAVVALSPVAASPAGPIESSMGRPYYDADVYGQRVLASRAPPPGIGQMPSNYTPTMPGATPTDFGGSLESAGPYRDPAYDSLHQPPHFRGVDTGPIFPQVIPHLTTPAWRPANIAYGYFPYMPYEHPVWPAMPGSSSMTSASQLGTAGVDGGENRDSTAEQTPNLTGTEKPHLGVVSLTEDASAMEGMGQMTHDAQGIPWLKFEYSRDRVQCTYQIRCDIDNVDGSLFSETFREENCIYPGAMVPANDYKGHRQQYETECNQIGWRLAFRNPILQNRRGLIQRAVDTYRNSSRDLSTRSRRARRILKQQEKERHRLLQQQQHHQHPSLSKRRSRTHWPQ